MMKLPRGHSGSGSLYTGSPSRYVPLPVGHRPSRSLSAIPAEGPSADSPRSLTPTGSSRRITEDTQPLPPCLPTKAADDSVPVDIGTVPEEWGFWTIETCGPIKLWLRDTPVNILIDIVLAGALNYAYCITLMDLVGPERLRYWWFDIACRYLWPTLILAFKIVGHFQPPRSVFEMVLVNIACIVSVGLGSFALYIAPIGRLFTFLVYIGAIWCRGCTLFTTFVPRSFKVPRADRCRLPRAHITQHILAKEFSPLRYEESIAYQRLAQWCSCKVSAIAVERSLKLLLFFLVMLDWTSDLAVGLDLVTRGLLWQSVVIFVLCLCDCVALNAHFRARPLMELSLRFHLTNFIVSLGEIPIAIITFMSMPVDQSDLSTIVLYVLSVVFTCLMVCFKGGMLFAQVRRKRLREKQTTSSITRTTTRETRAEAVLV
ncbi:unnamed protein product [Vitrella brassicaformis CCMP3155]|uniref:Uncharacterized protein n=1 Tax=Vitrella brassicaformis (strain CCMP3155) TaxID=1169540 RepID=A0A0G4FX23_VITBC|nr:unnamed protein product [Vitrella brassicaformis CCMP3155]|eukprot:CEM19501.1 unnamed protein product [Vitrella brassicaformis CCMP3155]